MRHVMCLLAGLGPYYKVIHPDEDTDVYIFEDGVWGEWRVAWYPHDDFPNRLDQDEL